MTISTTASSVQFQGNGVTTSFPYTFKIPTASDVVVTFIDDDGSETVLSTSQYAISGLGTENGGSVTYPVTGSPLAAGQYLTIERDIPYTQPTRLVNQSGFFPNVVEGALDRLTMLIQQAFAGTGTGGARSINYPSVDVNPVQTLLPASARASKFFAFDGSGNPVMLPATGMPSDISSYSAIPSAGSTSKTVAQLLAYCINVKSYGVTGDGVTNDTAAIAAVFALAGKRAVYFPVGTYIVNAVLTVPSGITVFGDGSGGSTPSAAATIIKTNTADHHIFDIAPASSGVRIRDINFQGTLGTAADNNSGVRMRGSSCVVENCLFTGMSGWGIYVGGGANGCVVRNNVVTIQAGALNNSACIALYSLANNCTVENNRCFGGGTIWTGIMLQDTVYDCRVVNNYIAGMAAYGIAEYMLASTITSNVIANNTINGVSGSALGGASGAGIYCVFSGFSSITGNVIANCNTSTSSESLTPAGIGISECAYPMTVTGNSIFLCSWHGIMFTGGPTNANGKSIAVGNSIYECGASTFGSGIYAKNASNVTIANNNIKAQGAVTSLLPAIQVNTVGSGSNVTVSGNNILGGGDSVIKILNTTKVVCNGNNVTAGKGIGLRFTSCGQVVCSGNHIDASVAVATWALVIQSTTHIRCSGNVLWSSYGSGHVIVTGVCTGSFFDESNDIANGGFDNIDNQSAGMIVTGFKGSSPGSINAQVGSRVFNSAPLVGQTPFWVCTAAGSPGTWTASAVLP